MANKERRFHIEQDRVYSGEWINQNTKFANTKVEMIPTYTVYEFVGEPSYQTPVFKGSKSECETFVKESSNN